MCQYKTRPLRHLEHVHLELVQEEGRVRLSVIDSGDRLGEVPAGQMFTPFFPTKKGGQGRGLLCGPGHATRPVSRSADCAMRSHSTSKGRPAAAAAWGTSERAVIPGRVFASRQ